MTAHSVDRQLITAVVRSAVAMGHSLERTASLADMDAIADRLSAVVLATLPDVTVDEDCTASVSLDEVEACCQGDRLSHECDLAGEHRGPHHCGWCSLRFADSDSDSDSASQRKPCLVPADGQVSSLCCATWADYQGQLHICWRHRNDGAHGASLTDLPHMCSCGATRYLDPAASGRLSLSAAVGPA